MCAILLQPFVPGKAGELLDGLRVAAGRRAWADAGVGRGEVWGGAGVGVGGGEGGLMKRVVLFPTEQPT